MHQSLRCSPVIPLFFTRRAAQVPQPAPSRRAANRVRQRRSADVDARPRRISRAPGGIHARRIRRRRDDIYWLNRLRVTAAVPMKPWLSATVQVQDARVEGRDGRHHRRPVPRSARPAIGARGRRRHGEGPRRVRGGRQELVFGDQRLIGHGNWLNTARSFDGVRAHLPAQEAARRRLRGLCCRHRHGRRQSRAASATTSTAPMGRWRCCRTAASSSRMSSCARRRISQRKPGARGDLTSFDYRHSLGGKLSAEPTTTSRPPSSADRWDPTQFPHGPDMR